MDRALAVEAVEEEEDSPTRLRISNTRSITLETGKKPPHTGGHSRLQAQELLHQVGLTVHMPGFSNNN